MKKLAMLAVLALAGCVTNPVEIKEAFMVPPGQSAIVIPTSNLFPAYCFKAEVDVGSLVGLPSTIAPTSGPWWLVYGANIQTNSLIKVEKVEVVD